MMARKDTRKGDRHKPGRKQPGDRHKNRNRALPFLAIDGEGWGEDADGVQHYQVLIAANDDVRYVLDLGRPLTSNECFEFLCTLPQKYTLISFSFGYDFTMMTRDLTVAQQMSLADRKSREETVPDRATGKPRQIVRKVKFGPYYLDALPRKVVYINKYERESSVKLKIYDTFSFFGFGYLKVLQQWKVTTEEELAHITAGKNRRADDEHDRSQEIEYSVLECKTLCRIMTKIRTMCVELGFPLRTWYGSGSVASALLTKYKLADYLGPIPQGMNDGASRAFFGGRFETATIGELTDIHYYDIVSAYPSIIQSLPCLKCGTWRRARAYDSNAKVALWRVTWRGTGHPHWGPLPYRTKTGDILFPCGGTGDYWADEVCAAVAYDPKTVKVTSGWIYDSACDHTPFSFVPELFQARREYKAKNDGRQLILKLALNSLYGKLAQTVGTHTYLSSVWAGMITAGVRAKLLGAIAQAPEAVVATATDSVASRVPLDLKIGDALGEWEYKPTPTIFYIMDGFSQSETNTERTRTRGINPTEVVWDRLRTAWQQDGFRGKVTFTIRRFMGLNLMAARGKPEKSGRWLDLDREVTFVSGKRMPFPGPAHNTMPRLDLYREAALSAPYKKLWAIAQEENAILNDAPDHVGSILDAQV